MARPKGSRNTKPTPAECRQLIQLLRQKAAAGDSIAAGELIRIGLGERAL